MLNFQNLIIVLSKRIRVLILKNKVMMSAVYSNTLAIFVCCMCIWSGGGRDKMLTADEFKGNLLGEGVSLYYCNFSINFNFLK